MGFKKALGISLFWGYLAPEKRKGRPVENEAALIELLAIGLANCQAVITDHGGLLLSLFIAGFVGSASHCIGMCGPFVMAQTVSRLEHLDSQSMSEFSRLQGALLVPYHLGRMSTYMVLGALAGGLSAGAMLAADLKWLSAALLVLAALFFLGYGLKRLGLWGRGQTSSGEGPMTRYIGRVAKPLFAKPTGLRGYGLGLALGFLPCGLLYGALAASASTGQALAGFFGMASFTLGTIPALVGVGLAGHMAGRQWQGAFQKVAPALLILNAGLLTFMAWRIVA